MHVPCAVGSTMRPQTSLILATWSTAPKWQTGLRRCDLVSALRRRNRRDYPGGPGLTTRVCKIRFTFRALLGRRHDHEVVVSAMPWRCSEDGRKGATSQGTWGPLVTGKDKEAQSPPSRRQKGVQPCQRLHVPQAPDS